MPRFTGTLGFVNVNQTALVAALDKELNKILIEGVTEWVRTVAAIIPNWSGMSRASLKPIADLVDVPIFASPVAGAPDRVAEGEALGFGRLISEGGVYRFEWRSDVFHLIYNEHNNANLVGFHLRNPGPYQSQVQAQEAFFRTVNARLAAFRFDFGKFLTVTNLTLR